jgi:hypothetical protein
MCLGSFWARAVFCFGRFVMGRLCLGRFLMCHSVCASSRICRLRQVSPFSAHFLSGCWAEFRLHFAGFWSLVSLSTGVHPFHLSRASFIPGPTARDPAFQRGCRNLRSAFPGLFDLLRRLFVPRLTYHVAVFWRKWLWHFSKDLSRELKFLEQCDYHVCLPVRHVCLLLDSIPRPLCFGAHFLLVSV